MKNTARHPHVANRRLLISNQNNRVTHPDLIFYQGHSVFNPASLSMCLLVNRSLQKLLKDLYHIWWKVRPWNQQLVCGADLDAGEEPHISLTVFFTIFP